MKIHLQQLADKIAERLLSDEVGEKLGACGDAECLAEVAIREILDILRQEIPAAIAKDEELPAGIVIW